MANLLAIHSVGASLRDYLSRSYPPAAFTDDLPQGENPFPSCTFSLLSSNEMNAQEDPDTTLSLFLYRVNINEHARNSRQINGTTYRDTPLSLDLHYLLTVWADSSLVEQSILAWAMQQLDLHPILDRSYLSARGGWQTGEVIHIIPAELTNEDMMRIWDTLQPPYHLSVAYVARVINIEPGPVEAAQPVVATRFTYGSLVEASP